MIRPRGGDFIYSTDEFEEMKNDINRYGNHLGPNDGFVCGILTIANRVDFTRCEELLQLSSTAPVEKRRPFTFIGRSMRLGILRRWWLMSGGCMNWDSGQSLHPEGEGMLRTAWQEFLN